MFLVYAEPSTHLLLLPTSRLLWGLVAGSLGPQRTRRLHLVPPLLALPVNLGVGVLLSRRIFLGSWRDAMPSRVKVLLLPLGFAFPGVAGALQILPGPGASSGRPILVVLLGWEVFSMCAY